MINRLIDYLTSGGQTKRSKKGKKKASKLGRRDESSLRSNKRKRPHSRSSEESGNETMSKRTRKSRQPIEIADKRSAGGKRSRSRACIEAMSDEESIVGKTKAKKRAGKIVKGTRISRRLQKMYQQDSDEEEEEEREDKTNVKRFYGKPTRRTRQQKISSEEEDNDDEPEERNTIASRNRGRRNRPHISGLFLVFYK